MNGGIEKIIIQNFKVFNDKITINLKSKNLLVYGTNGTGKSSLYFAIYTLLQATTKSRKEIQKYFDLNNDQNLLNIHARKSKGAFIKMSLSNHKKRFYEISQRGLIAKGNIITEMNLASEFISHRLLINFYNFRNSKEINLFQVFERDIFPFIRPDNKKLLFSEIVQDITDRASIGFSSRKQKKLWEKDVEELNKDLEKLIVYIDQNATKFLHDNFKQKDLTIVLRVKSGFDFRKFGTGFELLPPFIKLSIHQLDRNNKLKFIDRPQSFLNEARLTAVALSIRFVILERRPIKPELKILALDDLLISLDMSNRMIVLELIFKLYANDYQLIFFTHDLGFYNEIKRWTEGNTDKWRYLKLSDLKDENIEINDDKEEIPLALEFLSDNNLSGCAILLRKSLENTLKDFLQKHSCYHAGKFVELNKQIKTAQNILSSRLNGHIARIIDSYDLPPNILKKFPQNNNSDIDAIPGITNEEKTKLKNIRKAISHVIINHQKDTLKVSSTLRQAEHFLERSLNIGAHSSVAPLYKKELEDAIVIAEDLKKKLKDY